MKAARPYIDALLARGEPLPDWALTERGGVWTLHRNGRVAVRWRERDAPGVNFVVTELLDTLAAVTPIAEPAARTIRQQQDGGARGGNTAARNGTRAHSSRAAVMDLIAASLERGEAPETRARAWADEYGVSRATVYRWIKRSRAAAS